MANLTLNCIVGNDLDPSVRYAVQVFNGDTIVHSANMTQVGTSYMHSYTFTATQLGGSGSPGLRTWQCYRNIAGPGEKPLASSGQFYWSGTDIIQDVEMYPYLTEIMSDISAAVSTINAYTDAVRNNIKSHAETQRATVTTAISDAKSDTLTYVQSQHGFTKTHVTNVGNDAVDDIEAAIVSARNTITSNTDNERNTIIANMQAKALAAIQSYDPPTRAELTADKNEIITNTDNERNTILNGIESRVKSAILDSYEDDDQGLNDMFNAINTAITNARNTITSNTDAERTTIINSMQAKAKAALDAYDPPTRAELTADKSSIINSMQAKAKAALDDYEPSTRAENISDRNLITGAITTAQNTITSNTDAERTTIINSMQAKAEAALDAYDPPTRAELTADTNSIITNTDNERNTILNNIESRVQSALISSLEDDDEALKDMLAAIVSSVNSARDNVNANVDAERATVVNTVNSARDNVKSHVTSQHSATKASIPTAADIEAALLDDSDGGAFRASIAQTIEQYLLNDTDGQAVLAGIKGTVTSALSDFDVATDTNVNFIGGTVLSELRSDIGALNNLTKAEVEAAAETALRDHDVPTNNDLSVVANRLEDFIDDRVVGSSTSTTTLDMINANVDAEANSIRNAIIAITAATRADIDNALTDYDVAKVSDIASSAGITLTDLNNSLANLNDLSASDVNQVLENYAYGSGVASAQDVTTQGATTRSELSSAISAGLDGLNDLSLAELNQQTSNVTSAVNNYTFQRTADLLDDIKEQVLGGVPDLMDPNAPPVYNTVRELHDIVEGRLANVDTNIQFLNDLDKTDIEDVLQSYDVAKVSDITSSSGVSLTQLQTELGGLNDLSAADVTAELTSYDVAKVSDIPTQGATLTEIQTELGGLNNLSASEVGNVVDAELTSYDVAKVSDIPASTGATLTEIQTELAALNDLSAADVNATMAAYDVAKVSDLSTGGGVSLAQLQAELDNLNDVSVTDLETIRDEINAYTASEIDDVQADIAAIDTDVDFTGIATTMDITGARDAIQADIGALDFSTDLTGIARTSDIAGARDAIQADIAALSIPTVAEIEAALLDDADGSAVLEAISTAVENSLQDDQDGNAFLAAVQGACAAALTAKAVATETSVADAQSALAALIDALNDLSPDDLETALDGVKTQLSEDSTEILTAVDGLNDLSLDAVEGALDDSLEEVKSLVMSETADTLAAVDSLSSNQDEMATGVDQLVVGLTTVDRLLDLIEADESYDKATGIARKMLRGTSVVLLEKTVVGNTTVDSLTIAD